MNSIQLLKSLWMPFNKLRQFFSTLTPKMVTNQINALLKQAVTTFTCDKEAFHQNFDFLQALLDKTTAADVDFNSQFMDHSLWSRPNKAPVTYTEIYQNEIVSMGIFILKPDMKLPLHNHPYMHGLLKIIAGTMKIKTYSITPGTQVIKNNFSHEVDLNPVTLTASRNDDIIVDTKSKCCLLGPEKNNLHEIESIGGPAAFLDILTPPYNTKIENNGPRKCTYFEVCEEIRPLTYKLHEIPTPAWFWSDCYPYTGPKLCV